MHSMLSLFFLKSKFPLSRLHYEASPGRRQHQSPLISGNMKRPSPFDCRNKSSRSFQSSVLARVEFSLPSISKSMKLFRRSFGSFFFDSKTFSLNENNKTRSRATVGWGHLWDVFPKNFPHFLKLFSSSDLKFSTNRLMFFLVARSMTVIYANEWGKLKINARRLNEFFHRR